MNYLEGRGVKVKDTVFPGHAMKAYRGSAAVARLIHNPSGRLYSPAAFSSGKNSGYPFSSRLGRSQSRWTFWKRETSRASADIRTPVLPARRQVCIHCAVPAPSLKGVVEKDVASSAMVCSCW